MKNKNKKVELKNISELEKKVLEDKKSYLADVMDPLLAWIDEMKRSFSSIFSNSDGENRINLMMEKFEKYWINKKI